MPTHCVRWRIVCRQLFQTVLSAYISAGILGNDPYAVSDQSGAMEALGDITSTLKIMSENYDGEAGDEFCGLVVGLACLKEALVTLKDEGESAESEKEDLMAIGWRVEHDLSQFVRLKQEYFIWSYSTSQVCGRPGVLRAMAGRPVSAARHSWRSGRHVWSSRERRPGRVQWKGQYFSFPTFSKNTRHNCFTDSQKWEGGGS